MNYLKQPWSQQPQSAVEIDWSNPITRGLVIAENHSNSRLESFNAPAKKSGPSYKNTGGVATRFVSASSQYLKQSNTRLTNYPLTFLSVFQRASRPFDGVLIGIGAGTNRQILYVNQDNIACFSGAGGTTAQAVSAFSELGGFGEGDVRCAVGVSAAVNSRSVYLEGVLVGTNSTTVSTGAANTATIGCYWNNDAPSVYFNGDIYLSLAWNRALSDTEIRSISANPWQIFKPIPRRIFVPVGGEAGPQDLYPNLYTNDQTFYTHTLSQSGGTQTLTPSLYTNDQTFYTHTLSATKTLTPSLYTNSQGFYDPTLSATKALTATLHTNSSAFYGPSISVGTVTLTPGLYTNDQTFYAPVVQLDGGPQYIAPDLYTGSQTFYGATVQPGAVAITPSLYSNDQTFYSLTITTTKTLTATLFTNDQTFYAPIVNLAGGTQYVVPSLHTNVESFFSATVSTGAVQLYPTLYTNTQTFYNAAVGHVVTPDDPEIVLLSSPLTRTATLTSILR